MSIANVVRKQLGKFLFPSTYSTLLMPRTRFNYAAEVNGYQSSIIMACVGWIQRTFPEAPQVVEKRDSEGQWEGMDHPLTDLMNTPNPFYDGLLLQQAFIADLVISGNAYLLKVRSGAGRPVQLWWTPSTLITPMWPQGGTEFISHYDYFPGGTSVKIDIKDVVHYRLGLDHDNPRKGRSSLQSLLREVFTDDEAANMTAALLKNMGVPGMVISPTQETMMQQDADAVRERIKQLTTGDRRGEPIILSSATKVDTFGFNPQQLDLKSLRRIPEERISAVLGVPAIVAGLGAGLDRSTFSNMQEAREMAYESGIIPLQRIVASQTKHQLLSEYTDDLVNYRVSYDTSEIRVLQDDEDKLSIRTVAQVTGGVCKVTDAQRILGLPIDDSQDFYLRSYTAMPVRSGQEAPVEPIQEPEPVKSLKSLTPEEWEDEYAEDVPHWAEDKNPSLFAQEFLVELQSRKLKSILEIGCGNGRDSIFFAHAGLNVTAIDVSPSALELAKQNGEDADVSVDFQVGTAEKLTFEDGQFNAVFSLSVLHSTNLKKSIPEVARVIKKKGLAFIYLYGDTQYADGRVEDVITIDKYLELIKANGFKVLNFYSEPEEEFDEFGEKHLLLIGLFEKG